MKNKNLLLSILLFFLSLLVSCSFFLQPSQVFAIESLSPTAPLSLHKYIGSQNGFLDALSMGLYVRLVGDQDAHISGIIPLVNSYIASLYTSPPATTQQYFAHLMDNMGLPTTQKVYAQEGIGYKMFKPVIKIWQVFRDLAYSIYIIIFIVIGFMIMFRTKINNQTVISIQSALPNLIITLILITFSYAIAGFLIDIMYFLIYFIVYLAGSNGLLNAPTTIKFFTEHNAIGIFLTSGKEDVVINEIARAVANILYGVAGFFHTEDGQNWLLKLLVSFIIFFQMAKLIFNLFKNYLMVIVQIITAPLQILPNAIPGSKAFITWLKKTASYLAPFPILTALFVFAIIMAGPSLGSNNTNNPFGVNDAFNYDRISVFPYLTNVGVTGQDIAGAIALALIIISPAVVKMAQDFFQVKESPYSSEIMSGIGMGWKFSTWPISTLWSAKQRENELRRQSRYIREGTGLQAAGSGNLRTQPREVGQGDKTS